MFKGLVFFLFLTLYDCLVKMRGLSSVYFLYETWYCDSCGEEFIWISFQINCVKSLDWAFRRGFYQFTVCVSIFGFRSTSEILFAC